ncbi:MAG: hypothetical protein H7Z41_02945 [Cytophagales bacterium]|nr:hypothetical protein [Armatimonadota bacterium]
MFSEPADLPLVRLVTMPEKYHGIRVRTIGFVRIEFEGNVLYPHREDYEHALLGNGVWIELTDKLRSQGKQYSMKYCLIEGVFDAKQQGHLGLWSGTIKSISRLQIWSDPAKPRTQR